MPRQYVMTATDQARMETAASCVDLVKELSSSGFDTANHLSLLFHIHNKLQVGLPKLTINLLINR